MASILPIAAIVALGAALRIAQLDQSLIGDEMWSYVGASSDSFGGMLDFVRSDQEITPPLFTAVVWLLNRIGDSTALLRLPSLLSGILVIPLVYAIALRTLGRRVALTAAALAALSPFLAWYSIELRAYSLALMLAAASTLCLLIAIDRNRFSWWAAYAAFTCAAMYTHYTVVYVLFAQFVWVVAFRPQARRQVLLASAAAAVAFLPWVPGLLDDFDSPSQDIFSQLAPFGWHNFGAFTVRFAFGNPGFDLSDFIGRGAEVILAAGLVVAVVGLGIRWLGNGERQRLDGRRSHFVILFVMLAAAAPLGNALVSLIGDDQFLPRNLATSSTGVLLALATLLCAGGLITRIVSTTLVVGVFAYGSIKNLDPEYQRADYAGAAAFLDADAGPDDVILDVFGAAPYSQGVLSPAAGTLDVELEGSHQVVDLTGAPAAKQALAMAEGARLYVVGGPLLVGLTRKELNLEDQEPVEQRNFEGQPALTVQVFDIAMHSQR